MGRELQEIKVVEKLEYLRKKYNSCVELYAFSGAEYGAENINRDMFDKELSKLRRAYNSMMKRAEELNFETGNLLERLI